MDFSWHFCECRKVITHECPRINVLSIETSSCLNFESGMVMGKLNQQTICVIHYALLSTERSSCVNVEGNHPKVFLV